MSSNKESASTKIPEELNTDSGFLSGPLSEQLVSEELCDLVETSENLVVLEPEPLQLDSGLDLSESISDLKLSYSEVKSQTSQTVPSVTLLEENVQDIPPLVILFQQDDDGETQLHIAAIHGCEKSVATLIRVCPDKAWLNTPNDYGQTALHLAAASGHAVVTRMLVRAGANLAIRDTAGETPLHAAASAGHVECLQALLAPVPEQPQRRLAAVLNQKNYNGQTCVHSATVAAHIEALQTLVYYGANINAAEGLCGWTPLHVAAVKGDLNTTRYLLEKCAGVDKSALDYAGRSPRRLARKTAAKVFFTDDSDSSDSESDDDDDTHDSIFETLLGGMNAINVA